MEFIIDPEWAWAEFRPGTDTPWNLRTAAHLFRRAGFGATQSELSSAVLKSPSAVVDELLAGPEPDAFLAEMQSLSNAAIATRKRAAAFGMVGLPYAQHTHAVTGKDNTFLARPLRYQRRESHRLSPDADAERAASFICIW